MNCARNCENLLNFLKVIPKTLLVPFFSGHGVYLCTGWFLFSCNEIVASTARPWSRGIWY